MLAFPASASVDFAIALRP